MDSITRRTFLKCAAMGAAAGALPLRQLWATDAATQPAGPRPNIVVVLADDLGFGDAHCFDPQYSKIPTPAMDRLARQGVVFRNAHSPSSVCSPTRYGILTGRYPWRSPLQSGVVHAWDPPLIGPERLTLPAMLKQQGYATAMIGKWHLGMGWPKKDGQIAFDQPLTDGPTTHGFDYYFGVDVPNFPPFAFIENGRLTQQPTDRFEHKGKDQAQSKEMVLSFSGPIPPGWKFEHVLPTLTDKAVDYLGRRAKDPSPFFLYFALTTPHEPLAPSAEFKGKSGISPVGDLIMETDWALGKVLDALDASGLADNTLVIFTSDNGHCKYTGLEPFQRAGHRVSGPYRGYKTDIWEGGHRVPFIARWPRTIQPGAQRDHLVCLTDLMATFADLTGASLDDAAAPDSVSFLPLLRGGQAPSARDAVILQSHAGNFAVRQGQWLLTLCPDPQAAEPRSPVQLYDLEADPTETVNLYDKHPDRVARLTELVKQAIADGRTTPGRFQKNDVPVELWKTLKKAAKP